MVDEKVDEMTVKQPYQVVGRVTIVDELVVDDDRVVVFRQLVVLVREHDVVRPKNDRSNGIC